MQSTILLKIQVETRDQNGYVKGSKVTKEIRVDANYWIGLTPGEKEAMIQRHAYSMVVVRSVEYPVSLT